MGWILSQVDGVNRPVAGWGGVDPSFLDSHLYLCLCGH